MCCTRLAGNAGRKKSPKIRHLRTIAQLCRAISSELKHILTIGEKFLDSNVSPTCAHNMVNFGPVTAEICWRVWGTPANFNEFRVLASLLQRRRWTEVNQTLHDVCPSPGQVYYIYNFRSSCPVMEFLPVHYSLCVQILRSPILAALLHSTRAVGVSESLRRRMQGMELRNFRRGRHRHSAGRPSRWALAHILVTGSIARSASRRYFVYSV